MAGVTERSQASSPRSAAAPSTRSRLPATTPTSARRRQDAGSCLGPVHGWGWTPGPGQGSRARPPAPRDARGILSRAGSVPAGSGGELEEASPATGSTPGSQPAPAARHLDSWHLTLSLNYSSFPLRGLPYSSDPSVWWCNFRIVPFVSDVNFGSQQQTPC